MSAELLEDEFEAKVRDPSLIENHEEAVEVIGQLDHSITSIQRQIDVFNIKHQDMALTEEQESWLQNAAYACNMKRNQRYRVMQRDKEFRNAKAQQDNTLKIAKKAASQVKNERLKVEAETRKINKQIEHEKLQQLRTKSKHFMDVAAEKLDSDLFEEIMEEAAKRVKILVG